MQMLRDAFGIPLNCHGADGADEIAAVTASIAHEVSQPISGVVTNANTCLLMLSADPPNVDGAREAVLRAIRDSKRASDVLGGLRAMFMNAASPFEPFDLNEAAREVFALAWHDLQRSQVALNTEYTFDLPPVEGDRVQLQQVILNLLRNACEAMMTVKGRPRVVVVRTERDGPDRIRLSVRDVGPGIDPRSADRVFDAFHTTKQQGMGIGLALSRSIIRRHRGEIRMQPNHGPGVTVTFTIPRVQRRVAERRL